MVSYSRQPYLSHRACTLYMYMYMYSMLGGSTDERGTQKCTCTYMYMYIYSSNKAYVELGLSDPVLVYGMGILLVHVCNYTHITHTFAWSQGTLHLAQTHTVHVTLVQLHTALYMYKYVFPC